MRRILVICNTYYQLIAAFQMKNTIFRDDRLYILLSDHSVAAGEVAERLEEEKYFQMVYFIPTKKLDTQKHSLKDFIRIVADGVFGPVGVCRENVPFIDEMIFYNYSYSANLIFDFLQEQNPQLVCSRFEEGIASYDSIIKPYLSIGMRTIRFWRKLLRKKDAFELAEKCYCFYPELFPDKRRACGIPRLERGNKVFLEALNAAFSYCPEKEKYPQKYIFFASSLDIDGNPVGETELILKVADMVGKENLLVKMHPRDARKVYEDYGISVMHNSKVPWEVIQLNHDFSSHIFLSVSSGSILTASAMLGDQIASYYLYPLLQGRNDQWDRFCEQSIAGRIQRLQQCGTLKKMQIAREMKDILC